eukprot:g904.t1
MLQSLLLLAQSAIVQPCTVLMVTKGASAEGGNMVTQNDDAGGGTVDMRLTPIPAADWPPGSKRAIYFPQNGYPKLVVTDRGPHFMPKGNQVLTKPIGYIDQVQHTYGYWANRYGLINEMGLAMGESTMGARTVGWPVTAGAHGYNIMGIEELSHIGLERCATARCAIRTMGGLAVEYGFWSEDSGDPANPGYSDSAESLGICDKDECWAFHVLTGPKNASAVWAAQRVPDGHGTIIPNAIIIREMDLNDSENFLASDNILPFAQEMGWWDPAEPFDFNKAYGYYSTVQEDVTLYALYSGRRMWRTLDIFAPSKKFNSSLGLSACCATYPFSVKTEYPVSLNDMHRLMRDYYKDTPFDLSVGPGAGPHGSPLRYDTWSGGVKGAWERGIYIFRNMFSHIAVLRDLPYPLGPVLYYGIDNSLTTVYVPFFAAMSAVPESYLNVQESVYNEDAMFWVFNLVGNFVHLRYNAMMKDITKEQNRLDDMGKALIKDLTAKSLSDMLAADHPPAGPGHQQAASVIATLTVATHKHAEYVRKSWWKLAHLLFAKYSNGWITTGEQEWEQACPGYPAWWLRASDWAHFPRDGIMPVATQHLLKSTSAFFLSPLGASEWPLGLWLVVALTSVATAVLCWQVKLRRGVARRFAYETLA